MRQITLVKNQAVRVGVTLARLPVHDEHARNLRQLSEDDLVLVLDAADYAILQQVPVPLVLLVDRQFFDVDFLILLQVRKISDVRHCSQLSGSGAGNGDTRAVADDSRCYRLQVGRLTVCALDVEVH